MKIILVGYPGSQMIVPITSQLLEKHMPGFEVVFLNYEGPIEKWSEYLATYLETLTDENIIFSLDDYLVDGFDPGAYEEALKLTPCVKLCESTEQEHLEYPVTTQYTIWNRQELIDLLKQTTSPWDFEISGSKLFKGTSTLKTCVNYDNHSALSSRWEGIRTR